MVADYLTPVHRNPKDMPNGLAYRMDESLMYFCFYSTSTALTVLDLAKKIRSALKEKGYAGPHDIFQRKEQKKLTARHSMDIGEINHKQGSNSSVLESASRKTTQGHQRNCHS